MIRPNLPFSIKAWKKKIYFLAIFVLFMCVWAFATSFYIDRPTNRFSHSSVTIMLSGPKYLSPNETEEMYCLIQNRAQNDVNAIFQVVCECQEQIVHIHSKNRRNVIFSGSLIPQGSASPEMKLRAIWNIGFQAKPSAAGLSLWGEVSRVDAERTSSSASSLLSKLTPRKIANLNIFIAPIPFVNAITKWFLFGPIASLIPSLVRWIWKEFLGFGKSKNITARS